MELKEILPTKEERNEVEEILKPFHDEDIINWDEVAAMLDRYNMGRATESDKKIMSILDKLEATKHKGEIV